jgi:hypothetical protein
MQIEKKLRLRQCIMQRLGVVQTLYEQGTELMKEGLALLNSSDQEKINKFGKDRNSFGDAATKWVQENMGKACADRLLEIPTGFQQMRGSNQQASGSLIR